MQHDEIKGFTDQGERNKSVVNENKVLEEQVLRQIDKLQAEGTDDQRCLALAKTGIQEAFMWLNRGVFQPQRVKLAVDEPAPEGTGIDNEMAFLAWLTTQPGTLTLGAGHDAAPAVEAYTAYKETQRKY